MRVVVYEPTATGHHFAYLAHVMPKLADLASELILVTSPAAAAAPQFRNHLQNVADRFRVYTEIGDRRPITSLRESLREWSAVTRGVRELQPDHLYIAYGDGLTAAAGLREFLGRTSWPRDLQSEVLLMRGGYQYQPLSRLRGFRQRIAPRLVRRGPWTIVHHLNPDDVEVLHAMDERCRHRYRLMPDPVEAAPDVSKTDARRQLGIPDTGRYLGCAGAIDARKGIDLLLRAFTAARPRLRETDRLLLMGPVHRGIRKLLDHDWNNDIVAGRIVVIDRHLTAAEIGTGLAAMDLVCTSYPYHLHSASIVIRAALASRPVLGSAIGWMQRTIERFRLGATCNVLDREEFSQAIVSALDTADEYELHEAARRFTEFHAASNFVAHWVAQLGGRLGISGNQPLVKWEWVLEALPEGNRR